MTSLFTAAEALGAIGLERNVPLLKNSLCVDPAQEVRETCELAIKRMEEMNATGTCDESSTTQNSPFMSVDPAAPASSCSSIDMLRSLDEEKGMYERYAALFALRNNGGGEAVSAIIESLRSKVLCLSTRLLLFWANCRTKLLQLHLAEY